jgi:hypothetical protein
LAIGLEHRYYGKSIPFKQLTTENLSYLSSSQALLDAASFIESFRAEKKLPKKTKWVAVGGYNLIDNVRISFFQL